jgi:hypothetical protein
MDHMSAYHFIVFHNQSKHAITFTRVGDGVAMYIDGPGTFVIGPGGSHSVVLEDDNNFFDGDDDADKYVSWSLSDRDNITYIKSDQGAHGGWCINVQGPVTHAETGGNTCNNQWRWVGGDADAYSANIYL